jgi:hypothetical protein
MNSILFNQRLSASLKTTLSHPLFTPQPAESVPEGWRKVNRRLVPYWVAGYQEGRDIASAVLLKPPNWLDQNGGASAAAALVLASSLSLARNAITRMNPPLPSASTLPLAVFTANTSPSAIWSGDLL